MSEKKLTYNQRVLVTMVLIAFWAIVAAAVFAGFTFLLVLFPAIVLGVTGTAFALWGLYGAARAYVNERWSDDL